jgi:YebC/PmpR family DNA-binding regulatory protein
LRLAISSAKAANMPNNNIERAIKRGTGEIEGASYEQYFYEGYGHNGVAIIVETLTDNKQRTVSEVRHVFSKYGGNMAESGAVSWMFEQKGLIIIPKDEIDEDEMMMAALEAGADDIISEDDEFEIYTPYTELHQVLALLEKAGYQISKAEITYRPKNFVKADDVAEKLFKLIEMLEDLDDVQKLYTNLDVSESTLDRLANS